MLHRHRTTVIVPTYRGQRFLGDALASIERNLVGDIEVLLVDDGSTDATIDIARSFEPKLPLRILRPNRRGSWVAMTNIGIAEATGARSCILHQDDRWLPGRSQVLAGISTIECPMIWMQTAMIDQRGNDIGKWRFPHAVRSSLPDLKDIPLAASLYIQNWLAVPSVVIDTQLARDSGGLDEDLWYTADWDLWLKLLHIGPPTLVKDMGSAFRIHKDAQTVTGSHDIDAFRQQMVAVQGRHLWATLTHRDPEIIQRAGALSTETNAVLAAGFHRHRYEYRRWGRSIAAAGRDGLRAYLENSSLIDRLTSRLRLAVTGAYADRLPLRSHSKFDVRGPHGTRDEVLNR